MYRPGLVIGLGGTGRWALTHLKARLIEGTTDLSADGVRDALEGVHLLAFDVDSENAYEFAGHTLESEELYFSTPKIADVITNIRDFDDADPEARWPEFRTWISQQDARAYELSLLNTYMNSGAGQMRQWGRLGVLLQTGLFDRIRDVVRQLAADGTVSVYVVGSVCGGTGSAALFDVGAWVHAILQSAAPGVPVRMVGVFLLPAGFTADVETAEFAWLEACAYATLREMDRFQRAPGTVKLFLDGAPRSLKARLFDVCYLIEGVREPGVSSSQEVLSTRSRHAVDPAIADFLYSHLHPVSAGTIGSAYSNVVTQLAGHHSHKYSKMGTFSVVSPSRLIVRSLALDDAVAVVSALRSRDEMERGSTLLSTSEVSFTTPDGDDRKAYNAKVLLAATRYLAEGAQAPRATEVLDWLTAVGDPQAPALPKRPAFDQKFPEVGALRTSYPNQQVKDGVAKRATRYLEELDEAVEANRAPLLASLRAYLYVQSARLASEPSGLARGAVALAEVASVARRLRNRFPELDEGATGTGRLDRGRRRYRAAQEVLDKSPTAHSARAQRQLFEAARAWLGAEVDSKAKAALIHLLEEMSRVVDDVAANVHRWDARLEAMSVELAYTSEELDRHWQQQSSVPVRQVVVARRSKLENQRRREVASRAAETSQEGWAGVGDVAREFLDGMGWSVVVDADEKPCDIAPSPRWTVQATGGLVASDLVHALERRYAVGADLGIAEALESLAGSHGWADDLADRILAKASLLASSAPEATRPPAPLPLGNLSLFGPWGSQRPAVAELKRALLRRGVKEKEFVDLRAVAGGGPPAAVTNEAIWAVRTAHGSGLHGFGTVPSLAARYSELRATDKPLHIFSEERAASDKERAAGALLREGRLRGNVELFETEAVLLAREDRLLRIVLVLLAAEKLAWRWAALEHQGEWRLVNGAGSQPLAAGTGAQVLVDVLVDVAVANGQPTISADRVRRLLDETVRTVPNPFEEPVRKRLGVLSEDPQRLLSFKPDRSMDLLVRVLSHELLRHA